MSYEEQPDHIGRTLLAATVLWGAVGFAVMVTFTLAFPARAPKPPAAPRSQCEATVPMGFFDPSITTDPVAPVIAAPSGCATSSASHDPKELLHAFLEGAEIDSTPRQPPPAIDAGLRAQGAALYTRHCATCHGATGNGAGPDACALAPMAAVHQKGVFALRTTEHEALPTDEDIFRTITRGVHGTAMPPWFILPEHDRWALVAFVKSLSKQFDEDTAPPPMEAGQPPEATADRLAAGRALYLRGGCASCHGETGHGDGVAAEAFAVRPRDFTSGRFHRGSSAADIHETLLTGLDGTPMASFAKVMSADDLWNVSLFVHGLTPPMIARDAIRCPTVARSFDAQELFGARNQLHTLHP